MTTRMSPAKVNLLLKVVSRRPDGYHNLVSIVDIVSVFDVMHFTEAPDGTVTIRDVASLLPPGPENTIYRAVMLLRETYGVSNGIDILVEKRIPIGSGLGGGSSNAATALKELVDLWDLRVGPEDLVKLGAKIGADVPLFLYGKPCIMRGIGDVISSVELPKLWYVVVYPDVSISTKDVYNGLRIVLTKDENEVKVSGKFATALDIAKVLENDLEEVALVRCPEIKTIKERLRDAGAIGSLMSGSGSAVFGVFKDEGDARRAFEEVGGGFGSVFIANSV
jgi:4-diphosphocytidyl-2-C-methyl-D-erythritol kinase